MKRLIVPTALAFVLSGSLAFAQAPAQAPAQTPASAPPQHMHPRNPQKEAEHLAKRLNLTPDQTAKLEPILADHDQKLDALRSNTALAPADVHTQMRQLNKNLHEQLATVLTPDQLQQMHAHKDHHGKDATQPLSPSQPPSA